MSQAPLHWAAGNGQADLVSLLVEFGADVNSPGATGPDIGYPYQECAVGKGGGDALRVLLEAGAVLYQGTSTLNTALDIACFDQAQILLEHGVTHDIHSASLIGDLDILNELLVDDPDLVHEQYDNGDLPIERAARNQQFSAVALLEKHGSPVSARVLAALGRTEQLADRITDKSATQLVDLVTFAVFGGHLGTIKLLLDKGADRDKALTSLIGSFNEKRTAWLPGIEFLLQTGADPNQYSAKLLVLVHGFTDAARLLVKYGADYSQQLDDGSTWLHLTVSLFPDARTGAGTCASIQFLSEQGVNLDAENADGKSALDLLVYQVDGPPRERFQSATDLLVELGATPTR